jgi:hypothetical protein
MNSLANLATHSRPSSSSEEESLAFAVPIRFALSEFPSCSASNLRTVQEPLQATSDLSL